jgi:hypothetical protein
MHPPYYGSHWQEVSRHLSARSPLSPVQGGLRLLAISPGAFGTGYALLTSVPQEAATFNVWDDRIRLQASTR